MRRFIKTFTVKRHEQFTVVQDGDKKQFEVLRWEAGARSPVLVGRPFRYDDDKRPIDRARSEAIGFARKLAAEAEQSRAVQGDAAAPLSEDEEAQLDAQAAAAAQRLTPEEQEAIARRRP